MVHPYWFSLLAVGLGLENILGIRGSFAKGLSEKIPRMLSWASVDSVMFGQVK